MGETLQCITCVSWPNDQGCIISDKSLSHVDGTHLIECDEKDTSVLEYPSPKPMTSG